jgi:hypothetical protein
VDSQKNAPFDFVAGWRENNAEYRDKGTCKKIEEFFHL